MFSLVLNYMNVFTLHDVGKKMCPTTRLKAEKTIPFTGNAFWDWMTLRASTGMHVYAKVKSMTT